MKRIVLLAIVIFFLFSLGIFTMNGKKSSASGEEAKGCCCNGIIEESLKCYITVKSACAKITGEEYADFYEEITDPAQCKKQIEKYKIPKVDDYDSLYFD